MTSNIASAIDYTFTVGFYNSFSTQTLEDYESDAREYYNSVNKSEADSWYIPVLIPVVKNDGYDSVATKESVYYQIAICATDPNKAQTAVVTVLGQNVKSAFSTYVCAVPDCSPTVKNNNVIAYDITNSISNVAIFKSSQITSSGVFYVVITGFGGSGTNEFQLAARLL